MGFIYLSNEYQAATLGVKKVDTILCLEKKLSMQKDSLKKKDKETSFKNTKKASAGKLKKFKKGTILQREGDKSLNVFIIEKGLLKSYVIDEKGKEHIFMFA